MTRTGQPTDEHGRPRRRAQLYERFVSLMEALKTAADADGDRSTSSAVDACLAHVAAGADVCPLGRFVPARSRANGASAASDGGSPPVGRMLPARVATAVDLVHGVLLHAALEASDLDYARALLECGRRRGHDPACPLAAVPASADAGEAVALVDATRAVLGRHRHVRPMLHAVLATLVDRTGAEIGEIWRPDPLSPTTLALAATWWTSRRPELVDFVVTSRGSRFARNVGVPGRVSTEGRAIWGCDLLKTDPLFLRRELAERAGLGLALAFPLRGWREFVGIGVLLGRAEVGPRAEFLAPLTEVGRLLGEFVEHL